MKRHRKLMDDDFQVETKLREASLPSDVRQVVVGEDEQQQWSPLVDQEDPEPPHIKEEQEELWTNQEGEQLRELEESDIKFTLTPVAVKSEEDEETPQSSQLHQSPSEESRADCGGPEPEPEPARDSGPDVHLQPGPEDKTEDSSETEDSEGDWMETREPQSEVIHLSCDSVQRSFSCCQCGQRFGRKPHLNAHMRIHTGEKPFSCPFCGKRFSQKGNSISHMRLHTGEKPFSCSVCKKSFRYSGDVSRHMRIHTGQKKNSRGARDVVVSSAGSQPTHSCDTDGLEPPVTDDRTAVGTVDDGSKEIREPDPDLSGQRNDNISERDTRCNADKDPFSCSDCGRTFCRKDHLMSHRRTHTGEKPFSCSVCHKRFSCNGNILAHMRIHTREKPFSCSFCGKSFSQKGTLQLHERIHTGEKPFSCPFCDKRFAHKRRLTLHMSVHTEEKRFSCNICNKRFTWYTQLKTHKCVAASSQTGQNQTETKVSAKEAFSCSECGKVFSLKGNLKTHMRIHSGQKPFGCSVCGKSFKQNVHLTEHTTVHTGEKLYKCDVCGKGFNKKLLVRKHTCV